MTLSGFLVMHRNEILQNRLIDFSVAVCRLVGQLPQDIFGTHIARQILRCCTSPAPNYAEAQSAESRQDFIHKMRICLKELRETYVWLRLIERLELQSGPGLELAGRECNELVAIFTSSIMTASKRTKPQ